MINILIKLPLDLSFIYDSKIICDSSISGRSTISNWLSPKVNTSSFYYKICE